MGVSGERIEKRKGTGEKCQCVRAWLADWLGGWVGVSVML